MPTKIIITLHRDASKGSTVEVDGVSGPCCTKLTERLEAALGKTTKVEEKPEFHETPNTQQDLDVLQ
jgi:hypothetical protein